MTTADEDRKRRLSKEEKQRDRKKRTTQNDEIPTSSHYHISWMHAHVVTSMAVSIKNGFVITGDQGGIVKFWKRGKIQIDEEDESYTKKDQRRHACLEFVKAFTAHSTAVQTIEIDNVGDSCVSIASDANGMMLKFYEVATFDAVSIVKLKVPNKRRFCCSWFTAIDNQKYVAVSADTQIHIISLQQAKQIQTLNLHASVITSMSYIPSRYCVLSTDESGTLDVWDCRGTIQFSKQNANTTIDGDDELAAAEQSYVKVGGPCTLDPHGVTYKSKIETDLYELQKKKCFAVALATTSNHFAVYSSDHKIRVFDYTTAKIVGQFQESLKLYDAIHTKFGLDGMEYGKRAATEREIQTETAVYGARSEVLSDQRFTFQFDNTGQFLLIPCMLGIKILDWKKAKILAMTGEADSGNLRFVACQFAWGDAVVDTQMMLARGASTATTRDDSKKPTSDALLVALAYNQRRVYVFSHLDPVKGAPDDSEAIHRRDVWNEAPTASDQLYTTGANAVVEETAKTAILRTTMGDIHIQLFPQVPKTIENFVGHCKSGYYDNVIFHRVIAGFMLQTGDPCGDGTGGESIWGAEFEDEIVPSLRHDRPFTVSMANAGPNTNGSQFFITVAPTAWLDGKHTVFGRVVRGMDVCTRIEKVDTDKNDKPLQEVRIQSVDLE